MRTRRCGEIAVSILWDTTVEHPKLAPWMAGLGAATVLHLQSLRSKREAVVLVWPIHFFSQEPPNLSETVASARRALHQCINAVALEQDVDLNVGGLVIMSDVGGSVADVRRRFARDREVVGLRLGTSMSQLQRGLLDLARVVPVLIDHLLSGAER